MKRLICFLSLILPLFLTAQNTAYTIKSYSDEGVKAPNTHHEGDAWLNFLIEADNAFPNNITQATFAANATLDWHKHSSPQIIIVVEGKGYYQERGKEAIIMKKGDVIRCEENTEHWHTSSADSMVSYIAVYGSEPTVWTEKLTREYYDKVAGELKKN
ncbi:cupin domain-containing protein [Robertkochia flava]|uniref:cupin domain-containing protein n=1 Tax=Robertkochia flava TaxID=3447986 RepID=UPI001CCF333A|nr:cupin domain-containing protein [Robertkochia marina]